jgi:hypothetical protein
MNRRPSRTSRLASSRASGTEDGAVIVLDDEATIRALSSRAQRVLDLEAHAVTDQSFFRRVHPDDRNRIAWGLMSIATQEDAPPRTWLVRLKTGLGPWQWFKIEAAGHPDGDADNALRLHLYERAAPRGPDGE